MVWSDVLLENCKSHADHSNLGEPLLEVTLLGLSMCRHTVSVLTAIGGLSRLVVSCLGLARLFFSRRKRTEAPPNILE